MDIKWGIIGCGDVTEVKSGPAFNLAENSRLVAVMRRDGAKARDYAERHAVPYWSDCADEVIHHSDVNAVYIATPPGSHLEYALKVCAAGKPAYVEKPMARSAGECRQMTNAFARAGLPLFVAYYRRGLPRFRKVKELIETGAIGVVSAVLYRFWGNSHRKLQRADLPWRWRAEESGGGQFLDLGCHTLDILDYMLGPLQNVQGDASNVGSNCDVEDSVSMQFRLASGGLGLAQWVFASDWHIDRIEIAGTEGTIALTTFANEPVTCIRGGQTESFDLPNPRNIQAPLIASIVNQLNGIGECPSSGISATRTSEVMDIALHRYYGGRSDAFWDRPKTWPGRRL